MRKLLLVTFALLLAAPSAFAERIARHPFNVSLPLARVQRLVIDVSYGEFTVRNGSAGSIGIAGEASRDYESTKEGVWAQKIVDDTSVEFRVNGAEAVLRPKYGPNAQSWRARKFTGFNLVIDVPKGLDVVFETTAGEISMDGTFGNIDVDLRAGEIDLRTPRATVRDLKASCRVGEVRTNLGDEVVTREGVLPGATKFFNAAGKSNVSLHTTAGEVRVTLTK
ncbi:MAG: hypothetical protein WA208_17685 [Thermoanaerobaculia bacterium]